MAVGCGPTPRKSDAKRGVGEDDVPAVVEDDGREGDGFQERGVVLQIRLGLETLGDGPRYRPLPSCLICHREVTPLAYAAFTRRLDPAAPARVVSTIVAFDAC